MGSNRPTVAKLAAAINEMESKFVRRSINDIWHVIRMTNENADELRKRLDALQQPQKPVEVSVKADEQSLTAYVHQLEAFINDIEKELSNRLDVHRVDIDAIEHSVGQLGTTPPAVDPARIDALEGKLTDLHRLIVANKLALREDMSGLEQRFNALQTALAFKEPGVVTGSGGGGAYKPQRDTSWHPYDVLLREGMTSLPAVEHERVVVMLRGHDEILPPVRASACDWSDTGDTTIVAWRYAKEGE